MNPWHERLDFHCQVNPEHQVFVDETCHFTYGDLKRAAADLKFHVPWLNKGDRVLVVLPRNATSALLLASILMNDFVGIFIDHKTPFFEIRSTLKSVRPKALIAMSEIQDSSFQGSSDLPTPFFGPRGPWRILRLFESNLTSLHPQGLSWLLYTSGTSGVAKAVMLSEQNLLARTQSEISDFELQQNEIIFNCLPFSHDLGLNQILCTLWIGSTLFIKSRSVSNFVELLKESRASGLTATPLVWIDLMKTQTEAVETNLRYLTVSGGSLTTLELQLLKKMFPGVKVILTYGQTETYRTLIGDPECGGFARFADGTRMEMSPTGEIIHFGATAMTGYLFDPELSGKKKTQDGGVLTGDLVSRDSQGVYHLRGRRDDMVKRFEQRFSLCEVENFFRDIPGVFQVVAVVAVAPHNDWRQLYLGVFLEQNNETFLNLDEIRELAKKKLSYFKIPDVIQLLGEFPRTSSQKVNRQLLRDLLIREMSS